MFFRILESTIMHPLESNPILKKLLNKFVNLNWIKNQKADNKSSEARETKASSSLLETLVLAPFLSLHGVLWEK